MEVIAVKERERVANTFTSIYIKTVKIYNALFVNYLHSYNHDKME